MSFIAIAWALIIVELFKDAFIAGAAVICIGCVVALIVATVRQAKRVARPDRG